MSDTLYQGDALEVLPTLDGTFDAIITDLPYGTTACKWDTVIPFAPMWAQVKRLLKPRGAFVTTASQPFTSALVMSNPTWFKYELIWEKPKATGFLWAKARPMAAHENVLIFCDGSHTYNAQKTEGEPYCRGQRKETFEEKLRQGKRIGPTWIENKDGLRWPRSVIRAKTAEYEGQICHPTQKPVALYEYLIRTYTNEGDTVLDFCMGSGTTGVAAVNTGRSFVGVEMDAGYFAIAQKRIDQAQQQLAMPLSEVAE